MESSHWICSLKYPEFWKVYMHATWHAHWSFKQTIHPQGPSDWKEKKQPKKISEGKSRHWQNSKRHNFTNTECNYALQRGICSLEYTSKIRGRVLMRLLVFPLQIKRWLGDLVVEIHLNFKEYPKLLHGLLLFLFLLEILLRSNIMKDYSF